MVRPTLPLLVLPALHLVLCLVAQLDGTYGWFPFFFIDAPFSLFLMRIGFLPPLVTFGFGTVWLVFRGGFNSSGFHLASRINYSLSPDSLNDSGSFRIGGPRR